ncbi:MAG: class I SAM-dependent methyltransferase [Lachnospiraceae bacterium]|nr:class I SAM-dependent methyltransferase [Lachnospiraceae bacterium]
MGKREDKEHIMDSKDFDFQRIAEGYKKRPFLHKQVIERFKEDVTSRMFTNGLDIGCGAGLSSKALKTICRHVTGTDISGEMITVAREVCANAEEYDFFVSSAEELPAFETRFDIVSAAGVVQWVDKDLFLKEMSSVMSDHSYLLIYDFWISDKMKECSAYTTWWHDVYLKEFPRPFRNESAWTKEEAAQYGFLMKDQIQHEMEYEFDQDSFIEFMMIQSNVNAKIEGDKNSVQAVRKWFEQSTAPLFQGGKKAVIFTGYSWYMERFS